MISLGVSSSSGFFSVVVGDSSTDGPSADSPELSAVGWISVLAVSVVASVVGSGSSSSSYGVVYSLRLGRDVVRNNCRARNIISKHGSGLASGEATGAQSITCKKI